MLHRRAFLRALARHAIYPLVERITLAALLARKVALHERPQTRRFRASGRKQVLVVAAHPDDETIGCAGAIQAHLTAGDSVRVVIVTDGSGSRAGGLTPEAMARIRRKEVEAISDFYGGASFVQLGLREGEWQVERLEHILAVELAGGWCDLIYAPSCVDFHPEHLKVAQTVARVLAIYKPFTSPKVRIYEMQVPLGMELVNTITPLGGRQLQKARAIDLYASQRSALDLWKRQARYLGALYGCSGGAEVYWEVDSEAYQRVVAFGGWTWRDTPFASLTGRPFGDLRAHLRGSAVRRELRAIGEASKM